MANKLENLELENAHLDNIKEFLPQWEEMCKKTFGILQSYGLIQVSTALEYAVANLGGQTVISKDFADLSDGSDCKMVTVRRRNFNTTYSAPISSFKNKTGGLRVQVYDRIFDKFYYFVIPRFAYENSGSTIEIPFDSYGTPYRQTSKWWTYEVSSLQEMASTPIYNEKTDFQNNQLETGINTFNLYYEF
jgi:hypothetical protein